MDYSKLSEDDLDKVKKKFEDIEKLQKKFDNIFGERSCIIKLINFNKAVKIHSIAQKKIDEIYSGNFD